VILPEAIDIPILEGDDGAVDVAAPRRPATRARELCNTLAEDIIRGKLLPGCPLEETELARRFGVSRTPVREALRELAASGLIEARAHRSAIVARPTARRLRGMFEALAELEALCAGLSALHMTRSERQALECLHGRLGDLVPDGDPRQYHRLNEQFHSLIYAGSHNEYLSELTLTTRVRLSPFSRMQFQANGRLARSHAEHDRVIAAICGGDQAQAAAEMRAHIATVELTYEIYADGT
jgi:DNA-binding GntR family transcriptional regulator